MLEVLWSLSSPLGDIPRSSARSCGLSPLQLPVLPSHWLWWHISQWQHKLQWSLQNLPRRSHYSPACLLRHGHWWREMDCQYQILSSYFQINVKVFWGVGGGVTVLQNKTCIFVLTNMSVCQHKNTKLNFMKPSGVVAPGQKWKVTSYDICFWHQWRMQMWPTNNVR